MNPIPRLRVHRKKIWLFGAAMAAVALTFLVVSNILADAPDTCPVPTQSTCSTASPSASIGPIFQIGGVNVARVTVGGRWLWSTHNSTDCNFDRAGVGYAVDWNDPNQPGNHITTLSAANGGSIDVEAVAPAPGANQYNPMDIEVHPTSNEPGTSTVFNDPNVQPPTATATSAGVWRSGCGHDSNYSASGGSPTGSWGAMSVSGSTATQNISYTPFTCPNDPTTWTTPNLKKCIGASHVYRVSDLQQGITICAVTYDVHGTNANTSTLKNGFAGGVPSGYTEITSGGANRNTDNGAEKNGGTPAGNTCAPIRILSASIHIDKVANPTIVLAAGGSVTFTYAVTNAGQTPLSNVAVTDKIQGTNTNACSPITGPSGDSNNNGQLDLTETWTYTCTTTLTQTTTDVATATATPPPNSICSNSCTSSASAVVTVGPDVAVDKEPAQATIDAGQNAVFNITVTANGTSTANNVVLADVLPAGVSWTVSGPDASACLGSNPYAGGITLTCNFGNMAGGTSKGITLTGQTSGADCGNGVTNTATVSLTGSDTNPANDSSTAHITVNCHPEVSVIKTPITGLTYPAFNIEVDASGTGTSRNVNMTDTAPAGFDWDLSRTCLDVTANVNSTTIVGGHQFDCNLGDMAQGSSQAVTMTARSCPGVDNTADVSSNDDTNPNNNEGTAHIHDICTHQ